MENDKTPNNNLKIYKRLLIFGLLSVVLATAGYLIIAYVWFPAFNQGRPGTMNWDRFDVFTGLISMSLLAGGFTFALAEYIDTEKAKQSEKNKLSYDIYQAIFDKLTDPEQEAARRWILLNIDIKKPDEDIAAWYAKMNERIMPSVTVSAMGLPEGQNAIKLTLNCFDYIGFIVKHYWNVEKDSLDWISAPIAKVWRRIGPYVEYVRDQRKTTDYYLFAEHVGKLCTEYRLSKGMVDEKIAKDTP
jgi:hypothetical protein